MIPKRKPVAANRKARRAHGLTAKRPKRSGPPGGGPPALIEDLKRLILENDRSVSMTPGLMAGEKGWLFHRAGALTYAVTATDKLVTLRIGAALHRFGAHRRPDLAVLANAIRAHADMREP